MKIYLILIVIVVFGLNLTSMGQSDQDKTVVFQTLKVGDPAPLIKVEKWVKGPPVQDFDPGHVYIIEFGATWCGPCRDAIPHLSALAKKYKDNATVISFFVGENRGGDSVGTAYISKVERYVQKLGDIIAYSIAVDDLHETMRNTWLKAAQKYGLPTTFLVDQNRKIVWIGGGIEVIKLDHYVDQLIHGTFDPMAVLQEQEDWMMDHQELNNLINIADYKTALMKVDTLMKIYPERKYLIKKRFEVLRALEESMGYAYGWEIVNKSLLVNDPYDAYILSDLSSSILKDFRYNEQDYDLVIALSEQIIQYDHRPQFKASAYKNIANAWFMKGEPVKGEKMMQYAIENIPHDEHYERQKQSFQEELGRFKKLDKRSK